MSRVPTYDQNRTARSEGNFVRRLAADPTATPGLRVGGAPNRRSLPTLPMSPLVAAIRETGAVPCTAGGPNLWLSEDREEREFAIRLCQECPVKSVCWAQANADKASFGVWGGQDFSPNPASPVPVQKHWLTRQGQAGEESRDA